MAANELLANIGQLERDIATFLNPTIPYDDRATKGWWLSGLDGALIAMAIYAVLVAVGLVMCMADGGKEKEVPQWKEGETYSKGQTVIATGKATFISLKDSNNSNPSQPEGKAAWHRESVWESFLAEPIKFLQVPYNIIQVVLCGWMAYAALAIAVEDGYSAVCNVFDYRSTRMATIEYVFYLSKALDFFDTFFIIMRRKWKQFIFLHIYHHFSIFAVYWAINQIGYDGDVYYTIVANGLIHCVMYFYYLLTCFKIYPTWNKHLTTMQMVQFVTMISQGAYMLANGCAYPPRVIQMYIPYILSLLALFLKFYFKKHGGSDGAARKGSKKNIQVEDADKPKQA